MESVLERTRMIPMRSLPLQGEHLEGCTSFEIPVVPRRQILIYSGGTVVGPGLGHVFSRGDD